MTGQAPDWAAELLTDWSRSDWREASDTLGLPTVCPSFKGLIQTSEEVDVTGYSAAEVRAIAAAVDYLHLTHPDHYRVICRHFRPHMRSKLEEKHGDAELLQSAVAMVAEYVDKVLG